MNLFGLGLRSFRCSTKHRRVVDTDTYTDDGGSFGSITITGPTITTVGTDTANGTDRGSTGSTDTDTEGSTGDTEGDSEGDVAPEIFEMSLTPDPILFSGPIEVTVLAEAEGVRLTYGAEQSQGETEVELVEVEEGIFKGEIAVFTGLDNGEGHLATAVPWSGSEAENSYEEGDPVDDGYTIKLQTPGDQALWQTGYSTGTGLGEVRGVGTFEGSVFEFGMTAEYGKSRCYAELCDGGRGRFAQRPSGNRRLHLQHRHMYARRHAVGGRHRGSPGFRDFARTAQDPELFST